MRSLSSKLASSLLSLPMLGVFSAHARGAANYPVDPAAATAAVISAYPQLAGSRVELPEPVFSRARDPKLAAGKPERWPGSAAVEHVRLHCESSGACLPFYATVYLPAGAAAEAAADASDRLLRRESAEPGTRPLLRRGDAVTLLIDSGDLHLRLRATCLGEGNSGDRVRVSTPQHRMTYDAQVVDAATVRGSL